MMGKTSVATASASASAPRFALTAMPALLSSGLLVLGGCANPGTVHSTAVLLGATADASSTTAWPADRWWQPCGDSTLDRLVDQQAYTVTVTDVFWLSAVPFVALTGVVWLTTPKPSNNTAEDAGGAH